MMNIVKASIPNAEFEVVGGTVTNNLVNYIKSDNTKADNIVSLVRKLRNEGVINKNTLKGFFRLNQSASEVVKSKVMESMLSLYDGDDMFCALHDEYTFSQIFDKYVSERKLLQDFGIIEAISVSELHDFLIMKAGKEVFTKEVKHARNIFNEFTGSIEKNEIKKYEREVKLEIKKEEAALVWVCGKCGCSSNIYDDKICGGCGHEYITSYKKYSMNNLCDFMYGGIVANNVNEYKNWVENYEPEKVQKDPINFSSVKTIIAEYAMKFVLWYLRLTAINLFFFFTFVILFIIIKISTKH